jgi:hypothetical protein
MRTAPAIALFAPDKSLFISTSTLFLFNITAGVSYN